MITWTLDEKQADFILQVLVQRPYVEVHALVAVLMMQANEKPAMPPPPLPSATAQKPMVWPTDDKETP